ncbi:hypothetical protein ACM66Z_02275 [Sulfurovum sp. ST-21]|uniref:Big-1 domain-containing protein n=1 Tax=Sulfurovum indicum TaxID=2779528 RepID=A0A7M1S5R4_9BACT|nr:hypothetical protein [Sulfurovum indicum]QOR62321.1 hypothetical protein IMZ28_02265 [Sulfurovum indicum]
MKKNIVAILTFVFVSVLALTGCGSTSGTSSGTETTVVVEMQENEIVLQPNGTDFTLSLPFTKKLDSTYHVELNNFTLAVSECSVSVGSVSFAPIPLVLDGALNTQEILTINGSFDQNCTPTGYSLTAIQTVSKDSQTTSGDISFTYTYSGSSGIVENGYAFINATTPLNIGASNTDYTISMQLIKDGFVASGETVELKAFSNVYGSIKTTTTYTVATDANGIAVFDYVSPGTLPADGTTATITAVLKDENGTIVPGIEQNIELIFDQNSNNSGIDYTNYTFTAIPSEINITEGGASRVIDVYVGNNNQPVANELVKVDYTFTADGNGTVNSYEGFTDANGHVAFNYTAPSDITSLIGTSTAVILRLDGNSSIYSTTTVNFNTPSGTSTDYSNYTFTVIPSEINITEGGVSRVIDAYVGNNNQPVANETVTVDYAFTADGNGTMSSYTATTDANGHVAFNYTAPSDITSLIGTSTAVTLRLDNNTSINSTTTVNFNTVPGSVVDYSGYTLTVLSNEMNISEPGQQQTIDVYLENDSNGPAAGEVVLVDFFDGTKGTMNSFSGIVDDTGHVAFTYTAPQDISVLDGFTIRVSMENNSSKEQNIVINVDTAVYMIYPDANITVTDISQVHTIKVALTKQEAGATSTLPAVGKTVVAEFIQPIYGTLSQYEAVVGTDGYARFTYTSPERIQDVNDTNITFYYKENQAVTANTLLVYEAQNINIVEQLFVVPDSVTITEAGEEKNITIITVNADNVGISSTVTIEQPFYNDTDYGYFTPAGPITTDASGKAVIVYTAPSSISGLSERNITITETNQSLSKELNIKYNQATGPGIDYAITVHIPDSLSVDNLDQITVVIHELGDETRVIDDSNVHEVNLTSIFTNMLTFGSGASTATYANAGTQPIAVETKTLSGTAVIEVNASIFNGDQNVTINTLVPVTILSGPVSAMSLVYVGTDIDGNTGLYKNYYTIHAVDKYDNPAREGITLHPSIINGTKVIKSAATTGQITQGTPDTFDDATPTVFSTVDTNDLLAIVPNSSSVDKLYLGNWSIANVISDNQLELAEEYTGATTNSLSYVIGNSNRYIDGYGIATVDVRSRDAGYVTDADGNVRLEVTFDPVLAGHTVTISANAYDVNRTGAAKIAGLRWDDFSSTTELVPNDGNDHNVTLTLGISNFQELLVGLDIVPSSIISSDAACDLNESAVNDLSTDANGQIRVQISTGLSSSTATECEISWSKSISGIYREY